MLMLVQQNKQTRYIRTVVVPAAHTETDVQNGPLPETRSKIILLVGVRDKGVVGRHHSNVEMDEILQER